MIYPRKKVCVGKEITKLIDFMEFNIFYKYEEIVFLLRCL